MLSKAFVHGQVKLDSEADFEKKASIKAGVNLRRLWFEIELTRVPEHNYGLMPDQLLSNAI